MKRKGGCLGGGNAGCFSIIMIVVVVILACVAGTVALADSIIDKVILVIEANTEAEILDIQREIR